MWLCITSQEPSLLSASPDLNDRLGVSLRFRMESVALTSKLVYFTRFVFDPTTVVACVSYDGLAAFLLKKLYAVPDESSSPWCNFVSHMCGFQLASICSWFRWRWRSCSFVHDWSMHIRWPLLALRSWCRNLYRASWFPSIVGRKSGVWSGEEVWQQCLRVSYRSM